MFVPFNWSDIEFFLILHCYHMPLQISQCRRILYELGDARADEEPPPKAPTWKRSCAAILSQSVSHIGTKVLLQNTLNLFTLPHLSTVNYYKRYDLPFGQVEQLDDAMIFFLASLPSISYRKLCTIYQKFGEGTLKGQHIPRSKKGTLSKPPDLN